MLRRRVFDVDRHVIALGQGGQGFEVATGQALKRLGGMEDVVVGRVALAEDIEVLRYFGLRVPHF